MTIERVAATANDTLDQTGDTLIDSMTITPPSGDYLAFFTCTFLTASAAGSEQNLFNVYVGGTIVDHSEREYGEDTSIDNAQLPMVVSCKVSPNGSQAVEIRHRTTNAATPLVCQKRELNLFPIPTAGTDYQLTGTSTETRTVASYVVLPGMTVTPVSGDYLLIFSTSGTATSGEILDIKATVGGTDVSGSLRLWLGESSWQGNEFPVLIAAKISPNGSQVVQIEWQMGGGGSGTVTVHERTMNLIPFASGDIFDAVGTVNDTDSTADDDKQIDDMLISAPGADDYLVMFSATDFYGSIGNNVAETIYSIRNGSSRVTDSERTHEHEGSVDSADIPVMAGGRVSVAGTDDLAMWWDNGNTATRTIKNRIMVAIREVSGGTDKLIEPTKGDLTKAGNTPAAIQNHIQDATKNSLTLVGKQPSAFTNTLAEVPGNSLLTLVGKQPTVSQSITISPGKASLSLGNKQAAVVQDRPTVVGGATFGLTGKQPAKDIDKNVTVLGTIPLFATDINSGNYNHSDPPTGWPSSPTNKCIISFWVNATTLDASSLVFAVDTNVGGTSNLLEIEVLTTGVIRIIARSNGTTIILNMTSNSGVITAGAGWQHVLISFDLSDTNKRHIYVDDVENFSSAPTFTDSTIPFSTGIDFRVGASGNLEACLSEFYIAPDQFLDFSLEVNRREFISDSLKAAVLGVNGSNPTGVQPVVYLTGGQADFGTNLGTGDDYTAAGSPADCADAPVPNPFGFALINKLPQVILDHRVFTGKADLTLENRQPAAVLNNINIAGKADLLLSAKLPDEFLEITSVTGKADLVFAGKLPDEFVQIFIDPGKADLLLSGKLPDEFVQIFIDPGKADLLLTGKLPDEFLQIFIDPGIANLTLDNKLPAAVLNNINIAGKADLLLTGKLPDEFVQIFIDPGKADLLLTGKLPDEFLEIVASTGTASLVLSGKLPDEFVQIFIDPGKADLLLTGKLPDEFVQIFIDPGKADLVLANNAPVVGVGVIPISADLLLTGKTPTITQVITASTGKADLLLNNKLPAAVLDNINIAGKADLLLTGKLPDEFLEIVASTGTASLVLDGKLPDELVAITVDPGIANLTLTNKLPVVILDHIALANKADLLLVNKRPSAQADLPVTIIANIGNLVIAGKQPENILDHIADASKADLTIVGKQPSITQAITIQPGKAVMVLENKLPVVILDHIADASKADLTLVSFAPVLGTSILPGIAQLTLVGLRPSTVQPVQINIPSPAGLFLVGRAPETFGLWTVQDEIPDIWASQSEEVDTFTAQTEQGQQWNEQPPWSGENPE